MFFLLFLSTLALAEFDLSNDDFFLFKEFELKYSKKYETPAQRLSKLALFRDSLKKIRELNSQRTRKSDAIFGINYYSDLTPKEMGIVPHEHVSVPLDPQEINNGNKKGPKSVREFNTLPDLPEGDELPDYLSYCGPYVEYNTDHPKVDFCGEQVNQNLCGCCYAAAVNNQAQYVFANMTYYKNNKDASKVQKLLFSPQRMIDTVFTNPSTLSSNKRCCGGNSGTALLGQPTYSLQSDYPFVDGKDANAGTLCNPRGDQNSAVKLQMRNNGFKMWTTVEKTGHKDKVMAIKKIIHMYGPILVAIDASRSGLKNYKSGIFSFPQTDTICNPNNVYTDHQVMLVGYGKDEEDNREYFIGRNTWYSSWGENNNYIKISTDVFCGIGEFIADNFLPSNYIIYSGSCVLDPNCESCNTKTLECTKCAAGSNKDARGMCVKPDQYKNPIICALGKYGTYPECNKCLTGCKDCSDGATCK
ncbi:cysteine protease, putative, partial [Entamoeba invadens IP1]